MSHVEKPEYSEKYFDNEFEYRYVLLPQEMASRVKDMRILSETECKKLGITQSRGWVHYGFHKYC